MKLVQQSGWECMIKMITKESTQGCGIALGIERTKKKHRCTYEYYYRVQRREKIRQCRKANRAELFPFFLFWSYLEVKLYWMLVREVAELL